jgi:hypothetical protein
MHQQNQSTSAIRSTLVMYDGIWFISTTSLLPTFECCWVVHEWEELIYAYLDFGRDGGTM